MAARRNRREEDLISTRFETFKAKNGREIGVQGDDGEKCWIVHSDQMTALEHAIKENDAA